MSVTVRCSECVRLEAEVARLKAEVAANYLLRQGKLTAQEYDTTMDAVNARASKPRSEP